MSNSIFPVFSYDRNVSQWERSLYELTPVEAHGGILFKREDKFAPLGFHSINGSKLRQCIWLVDRWKREGYRGVISGSVVGSPQHVFIATICKHYGMGCLIVTGTPHYLKHRMMELAASAGAKFYVAPITYAKALQSISFKLRDKLPDHAVLETNITVDEKLNPPAVIEGFHRVGSEQVSNVPGHVQTIIIPCGSCNSVTSILYGIARFRPAALKNVILMGIGNNGSYNLGYIRNRLEIIGKHTRQDVAGLFNWTFLENAPAGPINLLHFNPNGEGFCKYDDWIPYRYSGIDLHPRYEAKCFAYMDANREKFADYWNDNTLFWIVGNEPKFI
jgi:hypothetical protein